MDPADSLKLHCSAVDKKEYCLHGPGPSRERLSLSQAPVPLEHDLEVIEWMIFHLDKTESDEFFKGLEDFRGRAPSQGEQLVDEFRQWWTSWIVSLRVHLDSDYQRQGKESLARERRGDLGSPVGIEELRERFPA